MDLDAEVLSLLCLGCGVQLFVKVSDEVVSLGFSYNKLYRDRHWDADLFHGLKKSAFLRQESEVKRICTFVAD